MKALIILLSFILILLSYFHFAGQSSHHITYQNLKRLSYGMTYKEVTELIGLPDEIRTFEYALHNSGCLHPKSYAFKPQAGSNISNTIHSIYADSLPCCSGMKESWRNSPTEFIYENNSYYFHHFNLYLAFSPEGKLHVFSFSDNGLLARTDVGTIFSPNGKLFWNKNIPVYTEAEIETLIQKL